MKAALRRALLLALAAALFLLSWFFRYNEPEGGFAGLLDDHFFYVVRGWQMLYGEWPDRDFVDIGAPLMYAISAAAQGWIGRGTLSEIVVCVTALSLAAALSFYAAARASGSMLAALCATLFQIALLPRFYNYPKLLAYALAIPATWALVDRPSWTRRALLAAITVLALLLRHDHGVFVAFYVTATILFLPWPAVERVREVVRYVATALLFAVPYLVYLQLNGGIVTHFIVANAWSMRDRARAPLVWPATPNLTTWLFYLLIAMPFIALALLAWSRDAWRPQWAYARGKIAAVALLAIALNVGFLRGALAARLADVAVPQTILIAWVLTVAAALLVRGRVERSDGARPLAPIVRIAVSVPLFVLFAFTFAWLARSVAPVARAAHLSPDPGTVIGRAQEITGRLRETWPLDRWASPDANGPMRLAYYFDACTQPTDRVFISQYLPQVAALARRPFAGGHPDLRPGFFATDRDQQLFIDRMQRQHVPVLIVPSSSDYNGFETEFPLVAQYFSREYEMLGDRDIGDGLRVGVAVRRGARPTSRYEPLDLPCFR